MPDRSERGVIFEADRKILAELAGKAGGWHELDLTIVSDADIDDRIDDEIVIALTKAEDRAERRVPSRLRELGRRVAEFEIHAVEELALGRVRSDEQLPDLHAV